MGIRRVSPEEEKVGYGGKDLQRRKVLSLEWKSEGVVDNESGESMELMEEVPLKELGEAELDSLVRGWRRVAGSLFQRRGKAYWKEPFVIRKEDDVECDQKWRASAARRLNCDEVSRYELGTLDDLIDGFAPNDPWPQGH